MCSKVENFHFINNSFIEYKYDLSKDKVHLNFDGVWRLEKNFSYFLQKVKEMKEWLIDDHQLTTQQTFSPETLKQSIILNKIYTTPIITPSTSHTCTLQSVTSFESINSSTPVTPTLLQGPVTIFESETPLSHHFIETPKLNNISSKINEATGFPPHPRYPIPFSVETPNHDNSRMNANTSPQVSTNPSDANNDLDLLKDLRKKYQNNPAIGYLNINSLRGQKFLN